MAETPTTAIASPVTLPLNVFVGVADVTSTRAFEFPGAVYRQFLAYVSGGTPGFNSGTEADSHEWGKFLQYGLNNSGALANYTVSMGTDGRWSIRNNTGSPATITMDGSVVAAQTTSKIVAVMTGFTTTVLTIAAGATATAEQQPFGFCCAIGRENDTGRAALPAKTVGAEMPDGSVYVWTDDQHRTARTFDLLFLPKDATAKAALSAAGTPLFPTTITKEKTPSLTPTTTYALPWSVYETVRTGGGKRLGYTTQFQQMVAGSVLDFVDGYFDLATLNAAAPNKPYGTWDQRWRWNGVALLTRAVATR
ncbi:MAG TPA: hypothetical protein VIU16_10680 [Gaiellaceae bacterium]